MDEISELWEDLKFEAGSIGNELLPKDRQEVYIGMGDRNADVLFIGNDPKLYLAEDYKVEPQSSGAFLKSSFCSNFSNILSLATSIYSLDKFILLSFIKVLASFLFSII